MTYSVVTERTSSATSNSTTTRHGYGDTTLRLKYNLWGNDGGRTALAVTPFVRFPTSHEGLGSEGIEGGGILPFKVLLPGDFEMGLTSRFTAARNTDAEGYHAEFGNSISLAHELTRDLAAYVEFFSEVSLESGTTWLGTFNSGLIYRFTANFQINAGINIGVTRSADDWNPFFGLAWRL